MKKLLERWLPVRGFEKYYEVSNLGRVRSLDRVTATGRKSSGRLLTGYTTPKGYLRVTFSIENKRKAFMSHRLVAKAFVDGETEERRFVNHIDGDKKNNRASNLEWCTHLENYAHAVHMGLIDPTVLNKSGEENNASKLKAIDVARIRQLYKAGVTSGIIAQVYSIDKSNINLIVRRKTWKNVA